MHTPFEPPGFQTMLLKDPKGIPADADALFLFLCQRAKPNTLNLALENMKEGQEKDTTAIESACNIHLAHVRVIS